MLKCRQCPSYAVCVACVKTSEGRDAYEKHSGTCKGPGTSLNRRFLLGTTSAHLVNGLVSVEFDENSGFEVVPSRYKGKPKRRSPNYLWYPYKCGLIPKGTAVCYRLPVERKKKILFGRLLAQSTTIDALVHFEDETKRRVSVLDLFLLPPSPLKPRRATTIKVAACTASWCVTLRDNQWTVTKASSKHGGHPKPSGERPLGRKAISLLPEVVAGIKELKDAGIPDKYLTLLMERRLSTKFQLRVEAVRHLRQGPGNSNESELIKMLQESETQPAYFAVRVLDHGEHNTAFVWDPSEGYFIKYEKTSQGFVRSGDRLPSDIKKWDVISWITKDGLQQLCCYPEFLAIDETYKVSNESRALYQASGIRGDYKTFTCFRSLIQEKSSEDVVRWIFNVSWPLLVHKFSPNPSVLDAIQVITIDAGLVQDNILRGLSASENNSKTRVFPNAQIRYCYWHEIKKPFRDEFLVGTREIDALKDIQQVLKYIFFTCESGPEQEIVQDYLYGFIKERIKSPELQAKVSR